MKRTIETERIELQRCKLLPQCKNAKEFVGLVNNEFASAEQHRNWLAFALRRIVSLAAKETPFYREMFRARDLTADDIQSEGDLPKLGIVTRNDVVENEEAFWLEKLPPGVVQWGHTMSSGTSGRPVRVRTSVENNLMFNILWHRQVRWFRWNLSGMLCEVRSGGTVGGEEPNSSNPNGKLIRRPIWRYVGNYFETGPSIGFNVTNDPQRQTAWLKEHQPDYILSDPSFFEELALANGGRSPLPNLQGILAVSSKLTESLRRQLTRMYGVPIQETYGLNEIGKVALRCDAGRYHVHTEHCHVEIVDDDGQPCRPGQVGKVIVTALRNPVMPLIRYDTGDLATAVSGECPCGRTLPAFGEILGRFRRYAGLPVGTRERYDAIPKAIEAMPLSLLEFLRQYQLHQYRDNRFELRLRTVGPIPDEFERRIQSDWQQVGIGLPAALRLVVVDDIPRTPGGKALDFTSEFYEDGYAVTATEAD